MPVPINYNKDPDFTLSQAFSELREEQLFVKRLLHVFARPRTRKLAQHK